MCLCVIVFNYVWLCVFVYGSVWLCVVMSECVISSGCELV